MQYHVCNTFNVNVRLTLFLFRLCRNSHACLLVFDVTNSDSLDAIAETWLPKIKDHSPEAVCMLVGNCSDQRDDTQKSTVQPQQARDFAGMYNLLMKI